MSLITKYLKILLMPCIKILGKLNKVIYTIFSKSDRTIITQNTKNNNSNNNSIGFTHSTLEQLEQKMLFDATVILPAAEILDSANNTHQSESIINSHQDLNLAKAPAVQINSANDHEDIIAPVDTNTKQAIGVIFIDSNITDYYQLINDIVYSNNNEYEIFIINNDEDGIKQMSEYLKDYHHNISSVHILSHSENGAILIGDTKLSNQNIYQYQEAITEWSKALTKDADILIYGCNLAASEEGSTLLNTINQLTNADIAASNNITGHAEFGGDWILEKQLGIIEAVIPFSLALQQSWQGTLATITVTNNFDIVNGDISSISHLLEDDGGDGISLREAILAANNTAGENLINFAYAMTINLQSALPTINETVTIDSYTNGYTTFNETSPLSQSVICSPSLSFTHYLTMTANIVNIISAEELNLMDMVNQYQITRETSIKSDEMLFLFTQSIKNQISTLVESDASVEFLTTISINSQNKDLFTTIFDNDHIHYVANTINDTLSTILIKNTELSTALDAIIKATAGNIFSKSGYVEFNLKINITPEFSDPENAFIVDDQNEPTPL